MSLLLPAEFERRISETKIESPRLVRALHRVLVQGEGQRAVARDIGMDGGQFNRSVRRVRDMEFCPTCGRTMPISADRHRE